MGWRIKFILVLIVFCAGFATAVYFLAPVPQDTSGQPTQQNPVQPGSKSDEFIQSVNSGLHKCVAFGKEAARRVGSFIKQKVDEKQSGADS
jgi:hypothetical protein